MRRAQRKAAKRPACIARYNHSAKHLACRSRYDQTAKGKIAAHRYQVSAKGKARKRRYETRPEVMQFIRLRHRSLASQQRIMETRI